MGVGISAWDVSEQGPGIAVEAGDGTSPADGVTWRRLRAEVPELEARPDSAGLRSIRLKAQFTRSGSPGKATQHDLESGAMPSFATETDALFKTKSGAAGGKPPTGLVRQHAA